MTPNILIIRLPDSDPRVAFPVYESPGAAGADVRANFPEEFRAGATLAPGERRLIPTGIAIEIPPGFEMQVRPRSGLALKLGLGLANAPGTIDSDYRGPLGVIMINFGNLPVHIAHGERIAQLVVSPVAQATFEEAVVLSETTRGTGGFGSTGHD